MDSTDFMYQEHSMADTSGHLMEVDLSNAGNSPCGQGTKKSMVNVQSWTLKILDICVFIYIII